MLGREALQQRAARVAAAGRLGRMVEVEGGVPDARGDFILEGLEARGQRRGELGFVTALIEEREQDHLAVERLQPVEVLAQRGRRELGHAAHTRLRVHRTELCPLLPEDGHRAANLDERGHRLPPELHMKDLLELDAVGGGATVVDPARLEACARVLARAARHERRGEHAASRQLHLLRAHISLHERGKPLARACLGERRERARVPHEACVRVRERGRRALQRLAPRRAPLQRVRERAALLVCEEHVARLQKVLEVATLLGTERG